MNGEVNACRPEWSRHEGVPSSELATCSKKPAVHTIIVAFSTAEPVPTVASMRLAR